MSMWTREFWRSYWIALRRSRRDQRARSFSLRVTFFLLCLLAYLAFLIVILTATEEGVWNAVFSGFILGTGTIAAFLIRRHNRRQNQLLNFSLTGQVRTPPDVVSGASEAVQTYLEHRAIIIASLLARGGSELHLPHLQLPPGAEVVSRQIQNALLRERRLWQELEPAEKDLAGAPDGCWSVEQRNQVVVWCEQLRLLRWVLGIDGELLPLAHFPKLDFSLSSGVLEQQRAWPSELPVKSWDVRVQRDIALQYIARVVAELRHRELIADSPEIGAWAGELRSKALGDSTDYLAGPKTIGELDDESLQLLGMFAVARERYATYLIDQLNTAQPVPFSSWSS